MNFNIELITSEDSNCSERVEWALNYKKLHFTKIKAPEPGSDEYRKINPFDSVPFMIVDGRLLSESMAMIEFLEEIQPQPSLFQKTSWDRAKVREICEFIGTTIHTGQSSQVPSFYIPGISKSDMRPLRAEWIGKKFKALDSLLFIKSQFVCGSSFSAADIFVLTMFKKGIALGLDKSNYSNYVAHAYFINSVEAVRESCPFEIKKLLA